MSDGYTKLFSSITDSTIWAAPDTTRLVWITMLAMSDQNGYIGASVPGLAARARVSLDACIAALDSFKSPDKWSRTPDFEGRRIADTDGGWLLLNHAKYRAVRDKEARREQAKIAMAALRDKRKPVSNVSKMLANVSNVSHGLPQLAHTEAEAEAVKTKPLSEYSDEFVQFWKAYPNKTGKGKAWESWEKYKPSLADVLKALAWQVKTEAWLKNKGEFIPMPATYLNGKRWLDESRDLASRPFSMEEFLREKAA